MTIFALFFCIGLNPCYLWDSEVIFRSAEECRAAAIAMTPVPPPGSIAGKFECRAKHVETWEPVQCASIPAIP
jgi:hypothetical protein